MQEADLIRLKHMLDAAYEIVEFVQDIDQDDFILDRKLHLAIVHLLEIIGEACNQVSDTVQKTYPHLPWKQIIGMRNRLIHGYFDIDLVIVWKTATEDIPPIIQQLEMIISSKQREKS
jgi:uncharacterized protein with HEPN domain